MRVEQRELTATRAVEWLRAFADVWTSADVPEARKELLHAICERIVVAGRSFVTVKLTPAAYNHGLALALPEAVMARPEGVERADAISIRIPIDGADVPAAETA